MRYQLNFSLVSEVGFADSIFKACAMALSMATMEHHHDLQQYMAE